MIASILLAALAVFSAGRVDAGTVNATSCSRTHVQDALTNAQDGDTVVIPAGSCVWTDGISMTLAKSLTIRGTGAISATAGGSGLTGTDQTTIIDHHPTLEHNLLSFTVSRGRMLRITGIAFIQDGSSKRTQDGVIKVSGGSNSVRIDHCHFVSNPDSTMTIHVLGSTEPLTGVIDHNYFDSEVGNGPFAVYLQNGVGYGDAAWAAPDNFGTASFLYVEDNRWRNGYLGDANTGGQRFVYRYNTAVIQANDSVPTVGYVANHGLTSGRGRSTRAFEYYGNVLSALSPGLNKSPFPVNGGTGLVWGNTVTQYRYVTSLDYTRKSNATYPYGSPPSGWGNCTGTSGTVWDGPGGYPCLDQPGRGAGDLLSGYPVSSTVNARTGTQAWPQQASSPIYVWSNILTPGGYSPIYIVDYDGPVEANRDFYQQFGTYGESGSFNGSRGVGVGLLSARPSSGLTPGVGYWATDTQTLYVATGATTWATYYTPFIYPHPLTSAVAPSPATNVQIR
jgi:hypothetical protein